MLKPYRGTTPSTVYMRDVDWCCVIRTNPSPKPNAWAEGTLDLPPLPGQDTNDWQQSWYTPLGFTIKGGAIITHSTYARFDPDGSAWYC